MSVWFSIPSCRPKPEVEACLAKWKGLGYKIALLRQGEPIEADLVVSTGEYLGWPRSTNILAREVLRRDKWAEWIIGGGDDYLPIPERWGDELADEFRNEFVSRWQDRTIDDQLQRWMPPYRSITSEDDNDEWVGGYGVVQPTGDRWGDSESARQTYGQDRGAIIDRVAGSPWMGREWCERAYLGNGPMWDGYHHLYADEELQEVAIAQGVFWQRRDLTQYHDHPARTRGQAAYREGHLAGIYSDENWARERSMFMDRKSKGFPGSEPCQVR